MPEFHHSALLEYHQKSCHAGVAQSDYVLSQSSAVQGGQTQGTHADGVVDGNTQEHDWIDLVFEEIEKQQPDFFAVSR